MVRHSGGLFIGGSYAAYQHSCQLRLAFGSRTCGFRSLGSRCRITAASTGAAGFNGKPPRQSVAQKHQQPPQAVPPVEEATKLGQGALECVDGFKHSPCNPCALTSNSMTPLQGRRMHANRSTVQSTNDNAAFINSPSHKFCSASKQDTLKRNSSLPWVLDTPACKNPCSHFLTPRQRQKQTLIRCK